MLLGEIARWRSRFEEAGHFYERAREVSQKNGHDAGTARAFGALGLLRMGHFAARKLREGMARPG